MTQLIFYRDDEMAQWAEAHFPECAPLARPLNAIGIASSDGDILGVAIYHNFMQYDIEFSLVTATPRWATPGNIRAILHYPFIQLGVKRMTARTAKSNKRARKMLEGIGAKLEGVHPYAYKGVGALCSYGLYKSDTTRWLS
jgi:RimJ/RimL family protein N-acetyltransferase